MVNFNDVVDGRVVVLVVVVVVVVVTYENKVNSRPTKVGSGLQVRSGVYKLYNIQV